jgi:hypothetical protein
MDKTDPDIGCMFRGCQYILCKEAHFQNVLLARIVPIVNTAVIHVLTTYVERVMEIEHMLV